MGCRVFRIFIRAPEGAPLLSLLADVAARVGGQTGQRGCWVRGGLRITLEIRRSQPSIPVGTHPWGYKIRVGSWATASSAGGGRSLDSWLFAGEERRRSLPWPARRRVAVDVARAVAYLHHECHRQILHLDIKPANILLDGGHRAHVSDFGVSVAVARDLSSVDATRGRGTPGYMAPEVWGSALSTKSDVYSYGMTLLELVGGRRSFEPAASAPDFTRDLFQCVVRERVARGGLMEVVDAAIAGVDEAEVEAAVKVALCCVQHRRDLRPSMQAVVDVLEGRVPANLPPESHLFSSGSFSGPLQYSSMSSGPGP